MTSNTSKIHERILYDTIICGTMGSRPRAGRFHHLLSHTTLDGTEVGDGTTDPSLSGVGGGRKLDSQETDRGKGLKTPLLQKRTNRRTEFLAYKHKGTQVDAVGTGGPVWGSSVYTGDSLSDSNLLQRSHSGYHPSHGNSLLCGLERGRALPCRSSTDTSSRGWSLT